MIYFPFLQGKLSEQVVYPVLTMTVASEKLQQHQVDVRTCTGIVWGPGQFQGHQTQLEL